MGLGKTVLYVNHLHENLNKIYILTRCLYVLFVIYVLKCSRYLSSYFVSLSFLISDLQLFLFAVLYTCISHDILGIIIQTVLPSGSLTGLEQPMPRLVGSVGAPGGVGAQVWASSRGSSERRTAHLCPSLCAASR